LRDSLRRIHATAHPHVACDTHTMTASTDLLSRARRALESGAAAALALAPLAMQSAEAVVLDTGDLTVDRSGAYFYNASGYFADWRGTPDGGAQVIANPDGSTKLFGTATASPGQFLGHNCYTDPYTGCSWYQDRGISLAWSGTLARPAAVGDRLAITVDFTVSLPDVGGSWSFGAALSDNNLNNTNWFSFGSGGQSGWESEGGTYHVHGVILSDPIYYLPEDPAAPIYWGVMVSGTANAPWHETYYSDTYDQYVTPYRSVTLTVPDHSIDITHVDASYSYDGQLGLVSAPVPEPTTWLLMGLGLGFVALRYRARS
jgi:PEP-CTERM motif